MIDLIREISQTMRSNKLRTVLTGIAVAWGIFMLIVLMGLSNGVVNTFNENTRSQGSNVLKVWGGITSHAWDGYKQGRIIELQSTDLEPIKHNNEHQVASVTAAIRSSAVTISTPHDYMTGSYEGIFPDEARQRALEIPWGRFINDKDMAEKRKVMVISEQVAVSLFKNPAAATGQSIKVGDLVFQVIGVYQSKWSRSVYIPYTTARILQGGGVNVNEINVELQNVKTQEDGTDAETKTRESLASLHDFRADDESAVNIWNRFNQQLSMQQGMNILTIAVWIIGLLTLLSGIIGVSNIMFVSVRERTHEIGIRRAIGAKPRNILIQIILESVSITTVFGYVGIAMGSLVTGILTKIAENVEFISNPTVDLSVALSVTIVLIIAGMAAGLFPALKAIKIKPVEALRDE